MDILDKITYTDQLILMRHFKFEPNVINEIKLQVKKGTNIVRLLKSIKKIKKKPINPKTILLFYEQPKQFFQEYNNLLENTSFYDNAGISIFTHYFYILYENYKYKYDFKHLRYKYQFDIYEQNFDMFFKEKGKYLLIQDLSLDTPLHKVARLRDKNFFLRIYQKLKKIGVLSEELLSIKNINEENCFNYIFNETELKKNVNKNNFDLYNNFINDYPSLSGSLSFEIKKFMIFFPFNIKIDSEQLKEKDFSDTYDNLYSLIEKNDKIINYLYYPQNSRFNFFNFLFDICQLNGDYKKMIKLLSELLNNEQDKLMVELCIIDHIEYVMRKMNSTNRKGEREIDYGFQLIKEILSVIFKTKTVAEIQKILSDKIIKNRNEKLGIINNLIINSNLGFDRKVEILKIIGEISAIKIEDFFDKDFLYIYQFFELYDKKEINKGNIMNKYKENYCLTKLFAEFNFIGKIISEIKYLSNNYDKNNINAYISELENFLNNKYLDIFFGYKIRYGLSNSQIQKILEMILLYGKNKNDDITEEEKEIINKNKFYIKDQYFYKIYKEFILSNKKITLYKIKNIIEKINKINAENNKNNDDEFNILINSNKNLYFDFLELFFSFNYDFDELMISNKENIINIIIETFKNKEGKKYFYFLNNMNKNIKEKPYESSFYQFSLHLFYQVKNINILSPNNNYTFYSELKLLTKKYLTQLIINWDKPYDYSPYFNFIGENILAIIVLLIQRKNDNKEEMQQEKNEIVNFLLDKYLYEIKPELKNRIEFFKKMINSNDITDLLSLLGNELTSEKDLKEIYKILLCIILSYIRFKYGNYNPLVFLFYMSNYKVIFRFKQLCSLIRCFLNNENKNILKHFFISDEKYVNENKYNFSGLSIDFYFNLHLSDTIRMIEKYLCVYIPELEHKNISLVFDYIKNKIDKLFLKEEEKKEKEKKEEEKEEEEKEEIDNRFNSLSDKFIYLFISSIGKEQNKDIYNTIIDLILNFDEELTIFSFLKKDPEMNYKEKTSHTIKIIQQISNDTIERTNNYTKKEILSYIRKETINKTTVMNLYNFILVLKEENNTLFNLVKKNHFFVINSFYVLYMNYLYCFYNKGKRSKYFNNNDEILQIIFSELRNFINLYNKEKDLKKNNKFNIGDILLNLVNETIIYELKKIINIEIKISIGKLINNLKHIFYPFLINDFEKEILVFIWFLFNFKEEKFIEIPDDNDKENLILDFKKINSDIITFFFDEFLDSINPDLKKKYEPFKYFFIDFIWHEHYYYNENGKDQENFDDSIDIIQNNNNEDFYFFLMIVYIKNKFTNYNPTLFIYIYKNYCSNYEERKNFFLSFIQCIREKEKNEQIAINLFLMKNEDMAYYNIKDNYQYFIYSNIYKFISIYLLDTKNSKYSFFNFYFSKLLDEMERLKKEEKEDKEEEKEEEKIKEKKEKEKELKRITNLISFAGFYYSSNNDKNIYNRLLDKFISFDFSFFDFMRVEYGLNDENKFRKIINNLEALSKNTEDKSINIDTNKFNFNIWEFHYYLKINPDLYLGKININSFINLYTFLKSLEKEKKSLINIIKSNYIFLIYFFDFFNSICDHYDYFSKSNVFYNSQNQKEMLIFVMNEIYSFYISFLTSKINNIINSNIIERYNNVKINYEILFHLTNIFLNRIKKSNKNNIIKEYENLKKILITFFNFSQEKKNDEIENVVFRYYSIMQYQNAISILFKEDINTFLDFIKFLINNCYLGYKIKGNIETDIYKIVIILMRINLEESIKIMPKLLSFIDSDMKTENDKGPNVKHLINQIIKNIFNNSKNYNFYDLNLLNEFNIFNNLDSSLYILNDISNNKANLFIMNRIKELLFVNNNKELFIEFIKKAIINQFVFDTLFNSFSKDEQNDLFLNNKNTLILSLYKYSEVNGYYYIQKLFNFLSNYISMEVIKKIIYSPLEYEDYSLFNPIKESLYFEDEKEKFLLFYSLSNKKKVNNYETIALLFEYLSKETVILEVFPFLKNNLDEIFTPNILKYSYSLTETNKKSIQKFGMNFYHFLLFIESFLSNKDSINSFNETEKSKFYYFVQILILEVTPEKLINYVENKKYKNKEIRSEIELFYILSLYEIKGTPIISIKKYFPKFYSKVNNFCQQFKKMNIYQLCLKQSYDNIFMESFKNILKHNNEKLNNLLDYPWIYYFSIILDKEYSLNLNLTQNDSIEKSILDLLQNDDILPFYDTNENEEFLSLLEKDLYIKNVDDYKKFIYSLLDFDRTSSIIIEKCSKKEIYEYKELFHEYINYLHIILDIYKHANISNYENIKTNLLNLNILNEDLSEKEKNKLISLKNSIKIEKIQYYIITVYERLNKQSNELYVSIKSWINNSKNKKEIKALDNISKERINLISYFNYLYLISNTILDWFKLFEKIDELLKLGKSIYNNYYFLTGSIDLNKKFIININYIRSNNKEAAKNKFSECLYSIGLDFLKNKDIKEDNATEYNINIYFYFDDKDEEFYEMSSDVNLMIFLNHKIYCLYEFLSYDFNEEILNLQNEKNINIYFESLYNSRQYKDINFLYKLFEPFLDNYKNPLCIYLNNTADKYYLPTVNDYDCFIREEIRKYIFNNLYPSMDFNYYINSFSNDLFDSSFNDYIDFSTIVNQIMSTRYHDLDNLNSLFQINAINYIINCDSYIHIFLEELYIKKFLKVNKANMIIKRKKINEITTINIIEGRKFTNSDLSEILTKNKIGINSSEYILKEKQSNNSESSLLRSTNNKNKKIKYKLKSVNQLKKNNRQISLNESEKSNSNDDLNNKIKIENKTELELLKALNRIKYRKKVEKKEKKFINIYDLMYSVKKYDNNILVLEKNDISEIMKAYSDKEILSLLYYNFPNKTTEEVIEYLENIGFNYIKI